jgi:tRNA pseudouridine55 synthase
MDFIQGEALLVNKPLEWTSFDVVNKLRYALKRKTNNKNYKVGHAGTLDPLASGLLIICCGKMTKRIDEFTGMDKEYTGTITLGATTPCFDKELPPDAFYPTDHITEELLRETTTQFVGVIQQYPPIYSAVKVDGQKGYLAARKGKEIELKAREITIVEFELTRIAMPEVDFRVVCSKGTYIRSLANDFGKALNSGAYLSALCRTKIGEYKLSDALSIADTIVRIEAAPAPVIQEEK